MAPDGNSEAEWQTRKRRIDPKLRALGWSIVPYDSTPVLGIGGQESLAVAEYLTANGPADYALMVDGKILGVVEAKKLTIGPQNALTQAERYSRGVSDSPLDFNGFRVPFLYSTNGEVIWFHCSTQGECLQSHTQVHHDAGD